jgi:hypothetical protein
MFQKEKPIANPVQGRDRLLETLLRLALDYLLFTPANASPIAPETPDATGAVTTAVIASGIHIG